MDLDFVRRHYVNHGNAERRAIDAASSQGLDPLQRLRASGRQQLFAPPLDTSAPVYVDYRRGSELISDRILADLMTGLRQGEISLVQDGNGKAGGEYGDGGYAMRSNENGCSVVRRIVKSYKNGVPRRYGMYSKPLDEVGAARWLVENAVTPDRADTYRQRAGYGVPAA